MNTDLNVKALNSIVSIAKQIINRRDATSNPLLNTVRCTFDDRHMLVESNDVVSSIRMNIPSEELEMQTTEAGTILLTESALNWLARVDGRLSIQSKTGSGDNPDADLITLRCGDHKLDLSGSSQDYQSNIFPEWQEPTAPYERFSVRAEQFLDGMRFCTANAGPKEYNTSGITFSADGVVLAMYSVGDLGTKACAAKVNIDRRTVFSVSSDAASVKKVCRGLASYAEQHEVNDFTVTVTPRGMWIAANGIEVFSLNLSITGMGKQIESLFTWDDESVVIPRETLSGAVNSIKSVASDANLLRLTFEQNELNLFSPAVCDNTVESKIRYSLDSALCKAAVKNVRLSGFSEFVASLPPSAGRLSVHFHKNDTGEKPFCIDCGMFHCIVVPMAR